MVILTDGSRPPPSHFPWLGSEVNWYRAEGCGSISLRISGYHMLVLGAVKEIGCGCNYCTTITHTTHGICAHHYTLRERRARKGGHANSMERVGSRSYLLAIPFDMCTFKCIQCYQLLNHVTCRSMCNRTSWRDAIEVAQARVLWKPILYCGPNVFIALVGYPSTLNTHSHGCSSPHSILNTVCLNLILFITCRLQYRELLTSS